MRTIAERRRTRSEQDGAFEPRPTSQQARERQLVNKAYNAVEKRIEDGTASAQELIYFMKVGSRREQLERQKIKYENELLQARTENLASMARNEELMLEAIQAFSRYSGQKPVEDA